MSCPRLWRGFRRALWEATASDRKSFPEVSAFGVLCPFHEQIFARTEQRLGPSHLQYPVKFWLGTQVWSCPSPFEAELYRCAMGLTVHPSAIQVAQSFSFRLQRRQHFYFILGLGKVVNTERRTLILYHHHDSVKLSHCTLPQVYHSTPSSAKKQCPALPEVQRRRKCATSARYRECHAEELLPKERERAVRRRTHLKTLKEGDDELERARARARANSARYHAQNRERLAARARDDRKTAFVAKYGFRAYLERRLDNL
ncbi:hypothetical protein DFH08DRAFT_977558 [Mycena albidolilacea]|uniref:Uncharacterized protein n=1 Tax=Mycena albidolilacea TaxID=1033008 RepID=A0AAD7E9E8_9AGAR|nr:hypothetical protein DFH08DRAFT_977558 [Mycena albidolilacea]